MTSDRTSDSVGIMSWVSLPEELLLHILVQLPARDILHTGQVSLNTDLL